MNADTPAVIKLPGGKVALVYSDGRIVVIEIDTSVTRPKSRESDWILDAAPTVRVRMRLLTVPDRLPASPVHR